MNDETTIPAVVAEEVGVPAIRDEEQFQDAIIKAKEKTGKIKDSDRFIALSEEIHSALSRQDSDATLTLITKGALGFGSSDIHYDTGEMDIRIRLRIDGELVDVVNLSRPEYKLLLERLKYKSDLKLNLTDIPQDGKYRITSDSERIDVRVSTLPVRYGENVVCRILDSTKAIPQVGELGFMWTSRRQIDRSLKKKNGTILVTGPTGSGKTTTLYSMLTSLNTEDRKIITLEDPIEYELSGIVQSEVDEKKNYTYSTGLKALMRQDPDIIMIGEIRDLESATISMQAAMTGHLVLSTLHTKSAGETIERLMNMGVPNYILASGLDVIIAQRLVRRLCPHCVEAYEADTSQIDIIKYMLKDLGIEALASKKDGFKLWKSKGCAECGMTGYKGRIGIYEVMNFSDDIRMLIRNGSSPREIITAARKGDLMLMREDGILKAMQGKTSLEELFKVIE
ncbi:type II/IV secretion system protein [Candidatus Gracilibacteria bacterium]|nr:type II/IV secretion system protein [Candidatus Gracilibacteria bacterium]